MRYVIINLLLLIAVFTQLVSAAPKATKEELDALVIRMERVERAMDERPQDTNKQGLITLQRQLKEMERELQVLRGENERLRNDVERMQDKQREMFIAIDKRMQQQELATTNSVEPATSQRPAAKSDDVPDTEIQAESPKTQVATTKPVVISSHTEDSPETTDAYRNAFLLLKQRRHDEAITAFENFLASYPNSKYSGNAQYWLAEANYVTQHYDRALTEFQSVIDQYPTSSKVPDARLKIGYTYYELGQWEEARVALTCLRAQFPNSTVAGLAQQRLERLEREGH